MQWIITKIIEQKFEVEGKTKEDAIQDCNENGNPYSVKIIKETARRIKE